MKIELKEEIIQEFEQFCRLNKIEDIEIKDKAKWVYRMMASADDKGFAKETKAFKDAVLEKGIFPAFRDSPVSARWMLKDITCYNPGDLNKMGNDPKTSWDSFSYTLQMAHNV